MGQPERVVLVVGAEQVLETGSWLLAPILGEVLRHSPRAQRGVGQVDIANEVGRLCSLRP